MKRTVVDLSYYLLSDKFDQLMEKLPQEFHSGVKKSKIIHPNLYHDLSMLFYGVNLKPLPSNEVPLWEILNNIISTSVFQTMQSQVKRNLSKSMIASSIYLDQVIEQLPVNIINLVKEHNNLIEKDFDDEGNEINENNLKNEKDNLSTSKNETNLNKSSNIVNENHANKNEHSKIGGNKENKSEFQIPEIQKKLEIINNQFRKEFNEISNKMIRISRKASNTVVEKLNYINEFELIYQEATNNQKTFKDEDLFDISNFDILISILEELGKIKNEYENLNNNSKYEKYGAEKSDLIEYRSIIPQRLCNKQYLGLPLSNPLKIKLISEIHSLPHHSYLNPRTSQGPIICIIDTSGSTFSFRLTLNALSLFLMLYGRKMERPVMIIPFSGEKCFQIFDTSNYTLSEMISIASIWYGGGTEPYQPINSALDHIRKSKTWTQADILMITDGYFDKPSQDFLLDVQNLKNKQGLRLLGFLIDTNSENVEFFDETILINNMDDSELTRNKLVKNIFENL